MIKVTDDILLYDNEIEEKFIRSPGSGGQKVNKTATSVQLRFDAKKNSALTSDLFLRLEKLAGQRMTNSGVIVITAHKYSTQEQNRQDALQRLVNLIRKAAMVPKTRRKTNPTRGSKERRLDRKRQKSNTKKGRGRLRTFD
jgi:ribosome-associated protein